MNPWHDYLAFPVAPLTLAVQTGALFVPRRSLRWILGAVVLLLWLLASFVILAIAGELVTAARRGSRPAEQETLQS